MESNIREYPSPPGELEGASVWYGSLIKSSKSWICSFSKTEKSELDSAMRSIKAKGIDIINIRKEDFFLPTLSSKFENIKQELLNGRGFILIRGIPVAEYSIKETAIIYYGIGMHFGLSLPQNAKGHVLGHVKDIGLDHADHNVRIYQTTARQTYHTDSCDLVFLLCLQAAMTGGLSSIVSSVTIYNEMLQRRPDLLKILFHPIETDRRVEVPDGLKGFYRMPVFNWFAGNLCTLYTRRYIESARRFDDVPPLTKTQLEALDLFDELANDPFLNLNMEFKPGDIQILHNHQILHDRTAYQDWPEIDHKRHLLRLWVSATDGRPLPETFVDRYGSIKIGSAMRGGTKVLGQKRKAPLDAE